MSRAAKVAFVLLAALCAVQEALLYRVVYVDTSPLTVAPPTIVKVTVAKHSCIVPR